MAFQRAMPQARRDVDKTSREAKKARAKAMKILEDEEAKAIKAKEPPQRVSDRTGNFEITIKVVK